jgi:hypothetical protein
VLRVKGDPVSDREKFEDKAEKAEAYKQEDKADVEAHKLEKMEKHEKHEEPDVEGHKLESKFEA